MQGYWRSAQQTQSTALLTCCQRSDLEPITWYRGQLAPDGWWRCWVPARFPPLLRGLEQTEEGPEEPALLQLGLPHQLQHQERCQESEDVSTGFGPCRTPHIQHRWSQAHRWTGPRTTANSIMLKPNQARSQAEKGPSGAHPGNRCLCSSGTRWRKGPHPNSGVFPVPG